MMGCTQSTAQEARPPLDLFPDSLPPIVPATPPRPGTIMADVLNALHAGPVTQAEYKRSWRLAAYVGDLEERGWSINRRDVVRPGYRSAITEYSLDRSDPRTAAALASRQRGSIDPPLAGLLAFIIACAVLLMRSPITFT